MHPISILVHLKSPLIWLFSWRINHLTTPEAFNETSILFFFDQFDKDLLGHLNFNVKYVNGKEKLYKDSEIANMKVLEIKKVLQSEAVRGNGLVKKKDYVERTKITFQQKKRKL